MAAGAQGGDGTDGTDAVTTFLTNENHNLADSSGNNRIIFAGGITDVEVFEGVTDKSNVYQYSARVNQQA